MYPVKLKTEYYYEAEIFYFRTIQTNSIKINCNFFVIAAIEMHHLRKFQLILSQFIFVTRSFRSSHRCKPEDMAIRTFYAVSSVYERNVKHVPGTTCGATWGRLIGTWSPRSAAALSSWSAAPAWSRPPFSMMAQPMISFQLKQISLSKSHVFQQHIYRN